MERSNPNPRLFFGVAASVVLADAVHEDRGGGPPHAVARAARGARRDAAAHARLQSRRGVRTASRAVVALDLHRAHVRRTGLLWELYRTTRAGDLVRTLALALVCGGAVGNLVDRLRSGRGVVDFIDVGVGADALADVQRGRHGRDLRCGAAGDRALAGGRGGRAAPPAVVTAGGFGRGGSGLRAATPRGWTCSSRAVSTSPVRRRPR